MPENDDNANEDQNDPFKLPVPKWIPFKLDEQMARTLYNRHYKHVTTCDKLKIQSVTPLYLPFHLFSIHTLTAIYIHSDADPSSHLIPKHVISHKYDGEQVPGVQVFASHAFPRAYANKFRGAHFTDLTSINAIRSDKITDGSLESEEIPVNIPEDTKMLAFSVPPVNAAFRVIEPFISIRELKRADKFLLHTYARKLEYHSETQYQSFHVQPAYYPCFMVEARYANETVNSLVSGVDGEVVGDSVYDYTKTGAIAASLGSVVGVLSGIPELQMKAMAVWALQFTVLPFMATSFLTKILPTLTSVYAEKINAYEEGLDGKSLVVMEAGDVKPTYWDVRNLWDQYDEWQARMTNMQQAEDWVAYNDLLRDTDGYSTKQKTEGASPSHPDDLGYYRIFNLQGQEATATSEGINQRFKQLALMHHPDRASSAEDKLKNARRFREISQAYTVLKDSTLRREYDYNVHNMAPPK